MTEPSSSNPASGAVHHESVLDTGTQRVARVYAEALLKAAVGRNNVDEILAELEALVDEVCAKNPELEAFLTSGTLGRERKAHAIRAAFEGRADELVVNALLVLNDHDRLDLLRPIVTAFRELRDQWAGRIPVQVVSAAPLPEDQVARLRQELQDTFQKEPVILTRVDPELLGGMVVRVGDWLFDRSVRAQLESIRNQIIARSSYEIQSGRDRFRTAD
jgi:F-type H+-transporting ATPase subunit delta